MRRIPVLGGKLSAGEILCGFMALVILIVLLPFKILKAIVYLWRSGRCLFDVIKCPDGHPNLLYGTWECQKCGSRFKGFVFRECPICHYSCGYFHCETCGLAIKNPLI